MKKYQVAFFLAFFFTIIIFSGVKIMAYTVDEVVYDHCGEPYRNDSFFQAPWGQHQGALHGVPSTYDWAAGARPGIWMNRGTDQSMSSWGQIYEWAGESSVTNIRVQVRNFKLHALVNGAWQLLEQGTNGSTIGGGNFSEDFTSSGAYSNVREEATGGISFTMVSGYNFHFWISTWPRVTIPAGTTAFYTSCEIRLIPDTDPNVNLSNAKYLAGISNDYYPTPTSSGFGPWPSLSETRHKFITSEWQTFSSYVGGSLPTSVTQYRNFITSNPLPPGVTLSGTTPPPEDGLYTENFDDNQAQDWGLSANVSVTGGKMSATGWAASTSAVYNGQPFSPAYTYKVDMYGNGGAATNIKQVVFNYTDSNNYYFVEFNGGSSGTATLKKKVGGAVSTLASFGTYATNGAWVTVEVNYTANKITVKATKAGVQTTLFNNVSDASLTSGKIGVSTAYDNVDFDNVNVSYGAAPPAPTPYAEDFNDNQAQNWGLSANVSVSGGKMSATGWAASTNAIYNGQSFNPAYTYKVDMYGNGGSATNIRQVVFNYTDSNNYYFVEFTGGSSGTATLKKKVGGTVSTLATYGTYATSGAWVTVEVAYTASKITVKATKAGVQTTLFNNVSDASLTSGKVGVSTVYDNADFDNVTVNY